MPWTLLRLTTNLVADGDWRGLARSSSSAPDSTGTGSIFVSTGTESGQALVRDNRITVRVGWASAGGTPVAGAGTSITVEPVTIDSLPHPVTPGQRIEILNVGEPRAHSADDPVIWAPLYLYVGEAAWASVRVSNAVNASAARVAVWVWTR
jgi:hypothetical protein